MVYKRYNSPFEERSKPTQTQRKNPEKPKEPPPSKHPPQKPPSQKQDNPFSLGFLDSLAYDDIMIIAINIILLSEEKEKRDVPMILTLGFLFLIQYIDAD